MRIRLRVREGECAAPTATEDDPRVDPEMGPKFLRVLHEIPSRVLAKLRMGRALPAAPLVEQDDAPLLRVEKSSLVRGDPSAGASVEDDDRPSLRIAALLEVDRMKGRDTK